VLARSRGQNACEEATKAYAATWQWTSTRSLA
jgi:hypothetical protein